MKDDSRSPPPIHPSAFILPAGQVEIADGELRVLFAKRSHNPILKEAASTAHPTDPLVRPPSPAHDLPVDLAVIPQRENRRSEIRRIG